MTLWLKNNHKIVLLGHFYTWNILNEANIACIVEMIPISINTDFFLPCSLENWPFLTFVILSGLCLGKAQTISICKVKLNLMAKTLSNRLNDSDNLIFLDKLD